MSKKPFKHLLGKRVILPFPKVEEKTEGGIILTPDAQKEKEKEEVEKTIRLKVIQVGEDCDKKDLLEGSEVFVQTQSLAPGRADILIGDDGKPEYFIIAERDIVGIY